MPDSPTPTKPRRSRRIKLLIGSMIGAFGALAFGWLSLSSQMFLAPLIKKQIARQLGARVELGSIAVSLLSGIRVENFQLYLPTSPTGVGYADGGPVEEHPSLAFAEFNFSWRVLALAKGCLCVDALQFQKLEARLEPVAKDATNWDGIATYRKAHPELTSPETAVPKTEPPAEPMTWQRLNRWIKMIPALFQVRIENVGLKDSFVELVQPGQKQVSRLNTDFGFWFRFLQRSRLETGVHSKVSGLRQGKVELPPVDLALDLNGNLEAAARSFSLEAFSVRLNDILVNDLSGRVSIVDAEDAVISKVTYSIAEKLRLNLTAASPVVAAFLPHLLVKGEATIEEFKAEGTLDLNAPSSFGVTVNGVPHPFPSLTTTLRLNEIAVQSSEWGVTLSPLSFSSSVHAVPSGDDQIDISALWQGATPGASFDKKSTHAVVDRLTTSGDIKARWPAQTLPEAKLSLEVQKFTVKAPGLGSLAVPVRVQADANGDGKSQKGAARLVVDVGTLANFNAGVEVGEKLGKVDGTWQLILPSLPALLKLAKQLDAVAKTKGIPEVNAGKLLFAGRVAAILPPGGALDSTNPLSGVSGQIDTKLNLDNVSARLDTPALDVKNTSVTVAVSGPLQKLKLISKIRFDHIGVGGTGEGDTKTGSSIAAKGGSIDLEIPTQIDGQLDVATLLTQLSVTPTLAVRLESLALPQALPAPLEKLEFDVQSELRRAQVFALKKLRLYWPGIGATLTARADGALDQAMKPASFTAGASLHLADAERKDVQPGITTSGGLDLAVNAKSKDMKQISIEGALRLLNLTVKVANKDKSGDLFAAEKIRGTLPFSQIVTLGADAPPPPPSPPMAVAKGKQPAPEEVEDEEKPPEVDEAAIAQENEHKEEEELNDAVKGFLDSRKNPFKEKRSLLTAVSYADVRPFLESRSPIVIDRIVAAGFEFGRSELDLAVSQNWISANEFLISFLGGKIQGSLQFAFDQRPVALRSSIHLTRLNTHKLVEGIPGLKEKAGSWVLISDPFIDSTIHLNYDFLTSDMSGGVEITSIGQEQLKMLLYFIDPDSQNPTITDIKRALNVGEVRQVSVPIKNGQIGLSVDVRLLKAPIPTPKLQRFPIAQLVDNFKSRSTAAAPAKAR